MQTNTFKISRHPTNVVLVEAIPLPNPNNPWVFTPKVEYDADTGLPIPLERSSLVGETASLVGCLNDLFLIDRGESVEVVLKNVTKVKTHKKNGSEMKRPVESYEWIGAYQKGGEAFVNKRNEIIDRLQSAAGRVESKEEARRWNDRARVVSRLWMQEGAEMHCCPEWSTKKRERVRIKHLYMMNEGDGRYSADFEGVGRANMSVEREIRQMLSGGVLNEFAESLEKFRFIFRNGFIDEVWCPRAYWEMRKLFLCGVSGNHQMLVRDGSGVTNAVNVEWYEPAKQPINIVRFVDDSEEAWKAGLRGEGEGELWVKPGLMVWGEEVERESGLRTASADFMNSEKRGVDKSE